MDYYLLALKKVLFLVGVRVEKSVGILFYLTLLLV